MFISHDDFSLIFWVKLGHPKKDDNVAGGGKSFKAYVAVLLIDYLCIAMPYILYLMTGFGRMDLLEHSLDAFAAVLPENI